MLKPLTQDFRLRPPDIMVPHPQQSRHHDNNKNNLGSLPPPLTASHSADAHYCPICGQGFIRSNLLAEHMHLCHQTEMLFPMDTTTVDYPCQQCDETFRTTLELEDHIRNAHQMLRFSRCTACGLFGMSIANGEYKCIHCGTISAPLGHNFYPPTIGGIGGVVSAAASSLTGTNSKLPPFNVKLTKQKSNNQQNNSSSNNNNSGGGGGNSSSSSSNRGDSNAVIINGSGPIPLPIKVEIKSEPQHNYHPTQQNSGSITTTSNKRHKCPDCEKTFKTSGTLSVHRRIHNGEAEIHTKERPYSCLYCSKTFTQSNTLKQHTRIHTGEKPFHCIYCEKAFSVKDYLTKHIRTHTGEKPYTCTFCDKRFTQRSALTVHTTKLHPI